MPLFLLLVAIAALPFGAATVSAIDQVPAEPAPVVPVTMPSPLAPETMPSPPSVVTAPHDVSLGALTTAPRFQEFWVAPHTPTTLWDGPVEGALPLTTVEPWTPLKVVRPQLGDRLAVWYPNAEGDAWVDARHVGPIDPARAGTAEVPPIGGRVIYSGEARITKYTCVELGGCGPTASGIPVRIGLVAVDPRLIPLGSRVWIQGMGTFLAADTGSAVKGAHIDVFSTNYREAVNWGMQRRMIVALNPE